jgi:hypothetical protein
MSACRTINHNCYQTIHKRYQAIHICRNYHRASANTTTRRTSTTNYSSIMNQATLFSPPKSPRIPTHRAPTLQYNTTTHNLQTTLCYIIPIHKQPSRLGAYASFPSPQITFPDKSCFQTQRCVPEHHGVGQNE